MPHKAMEVGDMHGRSGRTFLGGSLKQVLRGDPEILRQRWERQGKHRVERPVCVCVCV